MWVASRARNCLEVNVSNSTLFSPLGEEYGVRSNMYVPNRLSFLENSWSIRVVRKFSLTTCCPAEAVQTDVSMGKTRAVGGREDARK